MTLVVGVFVALAAAALLWPGPRRSLRRDRAQPVRKGAPARNGWARRRRRGAEPDAWLGPLLVEVAGQLRAGASVDGAWSRALARVEVAGPPAGRRPGRAAPAMAGHGDAATGRGWLQSEPGVPTVLLARAGESPALDSAIAACRLAQTSGTPLADVLASCAAGIVEADAAAAARRVALAGPTSTARLLGWLPIVSLVAGTALGADPLGVVLGGGLGLAGVLTGLVLVVIGRRWTALLVRAATSGGEPG